MFRLHGAQKPQFSTIDRLQRVVQNGQVAVVIAEYKFAMTVCKVSLKKREMN